METPHPSAEPRPAAEPGRGEFARLADDYLMLDQAIARIEYGEAPLDEPVLAQMRQQRSALREELRALTDRA
ncbi:YdcH family protein [Chitinimonas koreensis]|uniref:YdcH family protein n=1 Tax=Chitinimonas koreensis TaxID=356302 RepID=UPI00041DFC12|nr:YdcH family protein [Chitinimonas koreensis]QNM96663.1 YdcH family protein [Chitinimonas koreensis]